MLFFETRLCTVKREWAKVNFKSTYATVHTNIEIDIQPDLWQVLGLDKVKDSYKWFVVTSNRDLIQYNDIIVDSDNKEYIVQNSEFWKWGDILENCLELNLILNKTS